ncbi:MAG: alpha/beta hydrolase [Bacteroidota bacterium]
MKKAKTLLVIVVVFLLVTGLNAQNKAIEVRVVGKGEPILFFPGFTCTDKVWEAQVQELSKEFECHLFTFAGFGEVPPIAFPWYPKVEGGIHEYIKQNKLESAMAVGHSLGGTLALSLASKEPIFKKLIIVDALTATGALMFPNYTSDAMVYDSPYNKQILAMAEEDFSKMAAGMASGMTQHKEKQSQIIDWMKQADRETYVYGYTDYLKVDLREAVSKIKIPVVILAATQPFGEEMVKQTYESQYKNLREYELRFAQGASHFIMFDQPKWFMEQLKISLN